MNTFSEGQTVWITICPEFLVKTICIGYQQTTLLGKELIVAIGVLLIMLNSLLKHTTIRSSFVVVQLVCYGIVLKEIRNANKLLYKNE